MKKFYIISGLIILLGSLNYAGVCIPKGRFLTNEEKFLAVLEYHNNRLTVPYWVNDDYPYHIKYENIRQYLKENPDCCKIANGEYHNVSTPPPAFTDRLLGQDGKELILTNFKFRYLYNNNIIEKKILLANSLSNCGELKY